MVFKTKNFNLPFKKKLHQMMIRLIAKSQPIISSYAYKYHAAAWCNIVIVNICGNYSLRHIVITFIYVTE